MQAADGAMFPVVKFARPIFWNMEKTDKLIDYYFQRKIAGMNSERILESLQEQMMEDEERELIIKEVERRERHHRQMMEQQRYHRYLLVAGVSLLTVAVAMGALKFGVQASVSLILTAVIFALACISMASAFIFFRS